MNIHSQYSHLVPDLPIGAVIRRIGAARIGDFEFVGSRIERAFPRSSTQVIVVADVGYQFKLQIETNSYLPVLSAPATTATVIFDITKPEHAAFVQTLAEHPAHISTDRSTAPSVAQALAGSSVHIVKSIEAAKETPDVDREHQQALDGGLPVDAVAKP